jgi:site-specific recombinase XerC
VVLGLVSDIPTLRQAQELPGERLMPLNDGTGRAQSLMRFREYVQAQWSMLVLPTLKLSTQHGYKTMLRKHLIPYFGEFRLCDIARQDVQQFVLEKSRTCLAWQTVRNTWVILSSILDSAVTYEYLSANPVRGVRFPTQLSRREPRILSVESMQKPLRQLSEPYRTMLALVGPA